MTDHEPEDETPEGTGCGAVLAITIGLVVPLLVVYAISPEGFIVALGGLGWGAIIWVARHTPKNVADTSGRTPPPPPERGCEEELQVTMMRDTTHPNRWVITKPSPWLAYDASKETGT